MNCPTRYPQGRRLSAAAVATAPAQPAPGDLEAAFAACRPALVGYCGRMLGSAARGEDAVQETFLRAWRAIDRFEARASLRSWLYRIATRVCLDVLRRHESIPTDDAFEDVPSPEADPSTAVASNDSVRLAFVAALVHLPPRQRSVLILKEVLCWRATEIAELLGTTVPAVNSGLQRARAALADIDGDARPGDVDPHHVPLLARYVDAFARYDVTSLVATLRQDAAGALLS